MKLASALFIWQISAIVFATSASSSEVNLSVDPKEKHHKTKELIGVFEPVIDFSRPSVPFFSQRTRNFVYELCLIERKTDKGKLAYKIEFVRSDGSGGAQTVVRVPETNIAPAKTTSLPNCRHIVVKPGEKVSIRASGTNIKASFRNIQ